MRIDLSRAPVTENPDTRAHPLDRFSPPTYLLNCGRVVTLRTIHQYYVYEGVLCGIPIKAEGFVISAAERARKLFDLDSREPVVLTPCLSVGEDKRVPRGHLFRRWVKLPDVGCIAEFRSNTPVRHRTMVYSSAVIIWFQGVYGLGIDQWNLEQFKAVDWEKVAFDWIP